MRVVSGYRMHLTWGALALELLAAGCHRAGHAQEVPHAERMSAGEEAPSRFEALEKRIDRLETLAPGQGALMTLVGYHFGNLWFALDRENWPLAAFYLHECRESLEQAIAARPVRTLSTGEELNLKGIAQALDNTQFVDLEKAIALKDKPKSQSVYRDAMIVCHSCHQAAEKPFLQLRTPDQPPSSSIRFDPDR